MIVVRYSFQVKGERRMHCVWHWQLRNHSINIQQILWVPFDHLHSVGKGTGLL